jgi:hypothetical protein
MHLQQYHTSSETLVRALQEEAKQYRYPTVDLFLAWVRARISISFRRLDQPKVSCACLQSNIDKSFNTMIAGQRPHDPCALPYVCSETYLAGAIAEPCLPCYL